MTDNKDPVKKNLGGRPPLYNNCLDFDAMCEMYFEDERYIDEQGERSAVPYLTTGLSLYLGMDTDTLLLYGTKPGFIGITKRAKAKISLGLQERSIMEPQQATGCLFNLKCNHKMIEASRVDHVSSDGSMSPKEIRVDATPKEASQDYKEMLKNDK